MKSRNMAGFLMALMLSASGASATSYGASNPTIRIVPNPKHAAMTDQMLTLENLAQSVQVEKPVGDMFIEEMKLLGHTVDVNADRSAAFRFLWGDVEAVDAVLIPEQPEGYALCITPAGVSIAARDRNGLFHGTQTLLQLIEQSADGTVPCGTVRDWPDFEFRGMHTPLRPPKVYGVETVKEMIPIYEWMIRRLARYKYSHFAILVEGGHGMTFECYPDMLGGPWTGDDIRHLVEYAKARGIKPFPVVKGLNKFFKNTPYSVREKYAHLLERRKYIGQLDYQRQYHKTYSKNVAPLEVEQRSMNIEKNNREEISEVFQVRNPEVFEFLRPVIDEIYGLFDHPEYVHIGGEESFYAAINESAEDRGRYYAEYMNKLAAYIESKGSTPMMANDMLVSHEQFPYFFEAHGGPPLNTWTAVDYLNTNIVLGCWHYGYTVGGHYPDSYPMVPWLAQKGFPVIGMSWFKHDGIINLAESVREADGLGMLGTSFAIHLAIRDALGLQVDPKELTRRELGVLAATAEASWSLDAAEDILNEYDPQEWEKQWMTIK